MVFEPPDVEFRVVAYPPRYHRAGRIVVYLVRDRWDDFGFKTSFDMYVGDESGAVIAIGPVKVGAVGLESGAVDVPLQFNALDETYFSLGQKSLYYTELAARDELVSTAILAGLQDVAWSREHLERVDDEKSFRTSLARWISYELIEEFRVILGGGAIRGPFDLHLAREAGPGLEAVELTFEVTPDSLPSTNVHAVIGRNGVGKSTMLHDIVKTLTGTTVHETQPRWAVDRSRRKPSNLVLASFSPFDAFKDTARETSSDIQFGYVGLNTSDASSEAEDGINAQGLQLWQGLRRALASCLAPSRLSLFQEVFGILSSDPFLTELDFPARVNHWLEEGIQEDGTWFLELSSGHKAVVYAVASLVALVEEKTLVLFDEPESHLHPPLLSSMIRAIATIMAARNSLAILTTHSPVVLQELPRRCVYILQRTGDISSAIRPSDETFGANVSTLLREVFQHELWSSGFYRVVAEVAAGRSYEEALRVFDGQLGDDARAFASALSRADEPEG